MEDAKLQRGNCGTCRQRRVLGRYLPSQELEIFRCCACLDEHGDTLEVAAEKEELEGAANWWACSEPPQSLEDVPTGLLTAVPWHYSGQCFVTICDPEHCYFSGLGAERLWGAGGVLARYFSERPCAGQQVVELGAGCGLPGMVLARRGASVTLTDVPWLLQLLEYNVAANFCEDDVRRPQVAALRWGNASDVGAVLQAIGRPPDLVIGADLVYREQDFNALLACIASLWPRRALLAVQRRDRILEAFMRRLRELDWLLRCDVIGNQVYLLEVTPPSLKQMKQPCFKMQAETDPGCQAAAAA